MKFIKCMAALSLVALVSCDNGQDPSYEREVIKLKAENEMLAERLTEVVSESKSMQDQLSDAQDALDKLNAKINSASGVDTSKVKIGFADGIDSLQKQIESSKPNLKVLSYSIKRKELDPEFPFTALISIMVQNSKTSVRENLYWKGKGNIQGIWHFENVARPSTPTTVQDSGLAGNPVQPISPVQPINPVKPPRPAKPATKPRPQGDHVIDWGNAR